MKTEQTKHEFDEKNLSIVPITNVRTNAYNPKEKDTKEYAQVVKSLQINGFISPIIVRQVEGYEGYEIVDGEQRFTAAQELAFDKVPVYNLGYISDLDAKSKTIFAEVAVPFSEIDLSHLIVELDDANIALPYTEIQIADFRNMAEFNFGQYDEGGEDDDEDLDVRTFKVVLGEEAYKIVMKAIDKIKEDNECSESRALELMAADYIAGS